MPFITPSTKVSAKVAQGAYWEVHVSSVMVQTVTGVAKVSILSPFLVQGACEGDVFRQGSSQPTTQLSSQQCWSSPPEAHVSI